MPLGIQLCLGRRTVEKHRRWRARSRIIALHPCQALHSSDMSFPPPPDAAQWGWRLSRFSAHTRTPEDTRAQNLSGDVIKQDRINDHILNTMFAMAPQIRRPRAWSPQAYPACAPAVAASLVSWPSTVSPFATTVLTSVPAPAASPTAPALLGSIRKLYQTICISRRRDKSPQGCNEILKRPPAVTIGILASLTHLPKMLRSSKLGHGARFALCAPTATSSIVGKQLPNKKAHNLNMSCNPSDPAEVKIEFGDRSFNPSSCQM